MDKEVKKALRHQTKALRHQTRNRYFFQSFQGCTNSSKKSRLVGVIYSALKGAPVEKKIQVLKENINDKK